MTRIENLKLTFQKTLKSRIAWITFFAFFIFWTIATFFYPLDLLLFPLYFLLFALILGIPIYIVFALLHIIKNKEDSPFVFLSKLFFPFFLTLFYSWIIGSFNNRQYVITGEKVFYAIHEYKENNGKAPNNLNEIKDFVKNKNLMFSWHLNNMYLSSDSNNILCKHENIMDRSVWNNDSLKWIYEDF